MNHILFKAAVLEQTGQPLKIIGQIPLPQLKPGQVLVKLAYSGVCRSQLMETRGLRGEDKYLPHFLGHEGSGKVVAVGSEVSKVEVDDLVILTWLKGKGIDSGGVQYPFEKTIINGGGVTTFGEYAIVSENRCVALPSGIPLDVAVLFGCAIPTGAGMVMNEIKIKPGNSIVIWGLGGIGLSALIATQLFECDKVICVDIEEDKLILAKELGATHVINSAKVDVVIEIKNLTQGKGADFAIEASGQASSIEKSFDSIRRGGGVCIFASHPSEGEKIKIDPYELICGKEIRGSWGGAFNPDRDIPILGKLYLEGKLPLEKLLSKSYKLEEVNSALDDLESRKITRAILEIDGSIS
jgi:S-(hydroxymethyl)glutathione dehydrogenase/alcohol dehydrogenase